MSQSCDSCRNPEADLACELCKKALCDQCVLSPPLDSFSMMKKIPVDLTHTEYCRFCYDDKVEPALQKYEETLELAKNVFIFFKTQRKEIPLIRKTKDKLEVKECPDRDETILRLAYMAAELGFNAVIETDVYAEKIRNHAHQKMRWQGTGSPALIDENKLSKQDKQNQIYR